MKSAAAATPFIFTSFMFLTGCSMAASGAPPEADEATDAVASKIVGGKDVLNDNKYPFMASVYRLQPGLGWQNFCGGLLVGKRHILTAHHCVRKRDFPGGPKYDVAPSEIVIGIGTVDAVVYDRSINAYNPDAPGQPDGVVTFAVKKLWTHPERGGTPVGNAVYNDVAVLELEQPIRGIKPVDFVTSKREEAVVTEDDRVLALGWGATDIYATEWPGHPDYETQMLQEVKLKLRSNAFCQSQYEGLYAERYNYTGPSYTDAMLCAGGGAKDTCDGDSGGGLFGTKPNGDPIVIGITSWGHPDQCAMPGFPGVYARLGVLGKWVKRCIANEAQCAIP